jgi:hypothetical protein
MLCLISVKEGNRIQDPVKVSSPIKITDEGVIKALTYGLKCVEAKVSISAEYTPPAVTCKFEV